MKSTTRSPQTAPLTRKEAIEYDLVTDLMEPATRDILLKMEFPLPVHITCSALCDSIYCSNEKRNPGDSIGPGLMAVLRALRKAIRTDKPRKKIHFSVRNPIAAKPNIGFKSVFELDDDVMPVLTITTPEEGDTLNPN